MSARELINRAVQRCNYRRDSTYATAVLEDLTASGFSIVHKDEIHAPSVERCARVIDDFQEVVPLKTNARFLVGRSEGNLVGIAYAAALRELMKEVK